MPSAQGLIARETIAEIRVHGNLIATNDEVIAMAGVAVGDSFTATTVADVTARLTASKKFDSVQVLKRFASIEDASRITLVMVVNEGPVRLESRAGTLTPVRSRGLRRVMFMPILDAEDGYGVTFGVRAAYVDTIAPRSRLSFPLTYGGLKQAGAEFEQGIGAAHRTRVMAGAVTQQQKNPAFGEDDTRQRVWARVEHARRYARAGTTIGWQRVTFAQDVDRLRTLGVDAAFDTRLDPVLPRNAVLATASWERVHFDARPVVTRVRMEARGYLGLIGSTVLAARVVRESASGPLPPYLMPMLGGWSTLRGFKAGSFAGDMLMAESIEFRVPLSSPTRIGKFGVSIFADAGKSYGHDERARDQPLHRSAGAGLWFAATVFHLGLSVAHGDGADTLVNFGAGLTF